MCNVDSSDQLLTFFFFNDTATTEIYTLSLHDALPIFPATRSWPVGPVRARSCRRACAPGGVLQPRPRLRRRTLPGSRDRKSTRLNSSHANISYAVFCLKKKKKK